MAGTLVKAGHALRSSFDPPFEQQLSTINFEIDRHTEAMAAWLASSMCGRRVCFF